MNPNNPVASGLKQLKQLVTLPRRKMPVPIDLDSLKQLDLQTLTRVVKFRIWDLPSVVVRVENQETHLSCEMEFSTDISEWPHALYGIMFALGIAIAGANIFERLKDAPLGWPHTGLKGMRTTLYEFLPVVPSGEELLITLRAKLERILKEVPSVLNDLAQGPQHGRNVIRVNEEEEDEEEE